MSEDSFRASVFLCASATGHKLRPLIVFAGIPGPIAHDELRSDKDYDWERYHLTVQKRAFCDQAVMMEWIDSVRKPEVQHVSVLMLDSLKVHKMAQIKEALEGECATKAVYVSPGITGLAQPMDVAVMKPFKDKCRSLYLQHAASAPFCSNASQRRKMIASVIAEA